MKHIGVILFCQFVRIGAVARPGMAQNPSTASAPSDTAQHVGEDPLAVMKNTQTESENKAAPVALRRAQSARQRYVNRVADQANKPLGPALATRLTSAAAELVLLSGQSMRATGGVLPPRANATSQEGDAKTKRPW